MIIVSQFDQEIHSFPTELPPPAVWGMEEGDGGRGTGDGERRASPFLRSFRLQIPTSLGPNESTETANVFDPEGRLTVAQRFIAADDGCSPMFSTRRVG
jgi:hypothetical protein